MAHRAGTGDAPIPGLVTSRRNPAYRLKQKPKVPDAPQTNQVQRGQRPNRSPSPRARRNSPKRDVEEENRKREFREFREQEVRREQEARRDQSERDAEAKKEADEAEQKRRWAEQEARWADERNRRDTLRKVEEERQQQRQLKLKGAFATDLDDEDESARDRALADQQRKRVAAAAASTPTILASNALGGSTLGSSASSSLLAFPISGRPAIDDGGDPVKLRAALADPSASRSFAPGEVAEHFRRLSEMKRKFRRAEFGGPEKKREISRSRSRSREKYNSMWMRSSRDRR